MKKGNKALSLASKFAIPVLVALVIVSLMTILAMNATSTLSSNGFPGAFSTLFFTKNYLASEHTAYATGQILNNLVAYFFMLSAVVIFILSFVLIKHSASLKIKSAIIALFLFVPATLGLTGGFIDFIGHGIKVLLGSHGAKDAIVAFLLIATYVLDLLYYIAAIIYLVSAVKTAVKVNKGEIPVEEAENEGADEKSEEEKLREEEMEAEKRAALLADIRQIVREELDRLDRVAIVQEKVVERVVERVEEKAPVQEEEPEEPEEVEEEEEETSGAPSIKSVSVPRVPFAEKIVKADKDIQDKYNELKNEVLAYGASSRISIAGDTFRLHRKAYVKITLVGKTLKVYFALDPRDYIDSPVPVMDVSDKAAYADVPALLKVKSNLSVRRAKELIAAAFGADGIEREQEAGTHNYVKDIRAELRKK